MLRTGVEKIVWQIWRSAEGGSASRVCRSVGRSRSCHRGPEDERTKKASPSLFFEDGLELRGVSRWPKNRVAVFPHGLDRYAGGSSTSSTNHRAKRALLTGYLLGSLWEGGTHSPLEPNQPPSSAFFFCLAPAIRFVVIACFWGSRRRGCRTRRPSFSF